MKTLIVSLILILSACAPTSHVYVKSNQNGHNNMIREVVIMVEYLEIKEDSGEYWNFNENLNLLKQDELYMIAQKMLESKGYYLANKNLKTSGLITDRNLMLEHYVNNKLQNEVISPPYIVRSINLDDKNIQGFEMLLAELNQPISPAMVDLRSYVFSNFKSQMSDLNLSDDSAIFIIQVYKPKFSVFSNINIGFTASSSGSSIGIGREHQPPSSYAYLIHVGTGDVIWSNKISLITAGNQAKFFKQLPFKQP